MEVVKHNIQSKCSLNLKQFVTCHLARSISVHAVGVFTDWRFRGLHRDDKVNPLHLGTCFRTNKERTRN